MNNIPWKDRLANLKPDEKIGASLKWSDNQQNLAKKLNKFKRLGYLKCLGCVGNKIMYAGTDKPINEAHFIKNKLKKVQHEKYLHNSNKVTK